MNFFAFNNIFYKVNSKGEIINLITNKKEDIFFDMLKQPFRIFSYIQIIKEIIKEAEQKRV